MVVEVCLALAVAPWDGFSVVDDGGRDGHDIRAGEGTRCRGDEAGKHETGKEKAVHE